MAVAAPLAPEPRPDAAATSGAADARWLESWTDDLPNPQRAIASAGLRRARSEVEEALAAGPEPIVVRGPAGHGKSLLLRSLWREPPPGFSPLYVPFVDVEPEAIAPWLLATTQPRSPDPTRALLRLLHTLAVRGGSVLLLLDELQSMPPATLAKLRALIAASRADVRLVAAVLDGPGQDVVPAGLPPTTRVVELVAAWKRADVERLLEEMAAGSSGCWREALACSAASSEVDRILEETGGVPRLVRQALAAALRGDLRAPTRSGVAARAEASSSEPLRCAPRPTAASGSLERPVCGEAAVFESSGEAMVFGTSATGSSGSCASDGDLRVVSTSGSRPGAAACATPAASEAAEVTPRSAPEPVSVEADAPRTTLASVPRGAAGGGLRLRARLGAARALPRAVTAAVRPIGVASAEGIRSARAAGKAQLAGGLRAVRAGNARLAAGLRAARDAGQVQLTRGGCAARAGASWLGRRAGFARASALRLGGAALRSTFAAVGAAARVGVGAHRQGLAGAGGILRSAREALAIAFQPTRRRRALFATASLSLAALACLPIVSAVAALRLALAPTGSSAPAPLEQSAAARLEAGRDTVASRGDVAPAGEAAPPEEPAPERAGAPAGETVALHVNSHPWAYVEIDGVRAGSTPFTVALEPGAYRFRVAMSDGRVLEREVVVSAKSMHLAFR